MTRPPEPDLRDWFAGNALTALMKRFGAFERQGADPQTLAHRAYEYADAMMAAREQTP